MCVYTTYTCHVCRKSTENMISPWCSSAYAVYLRATVLQHSGGTDCVCVGMYV